MSESMREIETGGKRVKKAMIINERAFFQPKKKKKQNYFLLEL